MPEYRTDKAQYISRYQDLLDGMFDQRLKILELGIYRGGSLMMWRDLFPRSQIYGIDHNESSRIIANRIRTFHGSQDDLNFLRAVVNQTGTLDIIIDDASHIGALTLASFRFLWNYLSSGGWYIIEDWGTGYWEDWPDGKQPGNMVDLVKSLIDEMGSKDSEDRPPRYEKVVFYPAMACVKKP